MKIGGVLLLIFLFCHGCCTCESYDEITPNQFKGSDIQRIRSAINAAKGKSNKVVIPSRNSNGSGFWLIDSAILLPGEMTVILDNCTIQLSDSCRDNMFRSDNVGEGIMNPEWLKDISIIGTGHVILKGAKNPRATGDSGKTLGKATYGTDAGKTGRKQTGDWRNILILMGYLDGFILKNVSIENSHAWAVSFERTMNADISDIHLFNPSEISIESNKIKVLNKDGINLRHGCKNFRISDVSGITGDDFIALSILGIHSDHPEGGSLNSTNVTSRKWNGTEDDIENIYISNIACQSPTRGVAIRANDSSGVRNVYINGLAWHGNYNSILVGGKGYGRPSIPGKINNIHVMNFSGNGRSLVHIESAVEDCSFVSGLYSGEGEIVTYNITGEKPNEIRGDKEMVRNVLTQNLIKLRN
jgi:hypothetical protein